MKIIKMTGKQFVLGSGTNITTGGLDVLPFERLGNLFTANPYHNCVPNLMAVLMSV